MLPKLSTSQTKQNNKDSSISEKLLPITEVSHHSEYHDDMFSITQDPVEKSELSVICKHKNSLTHPNFEAPVDDRVFSSFVSLFAENVILKERDNLAFHIARNVPKKSISNKLFIEVVKNIITKMPHFLNLEGMLTLSDSLMYSGQPIFNGQFYKNVFPPAFCETVCCKFASNALVKEKYFNSYFMSRKPSRARNNPNIINDNSVYISASENDVIALPSISTLDSENMENMTNSKLNLLCIFTNKTVCEENFADLKKFHKGEDIRMILPMTWNIVVAYNVLTISDENNQHITIFSRNPLKAKFDYKYSYLPPKKCFTSMGLANGLKKRKNTFQNGRIKTVISPPNKSTKLIRKDSRGDNKEIRKSPKMVSGKKKGRDSFLPLLEPLLLNYVEQNKTKQVLMYKAHSIEGISESENEKCFYKTLEKLLDKSVQYEGETVNLVFEPFKLISRLKKEEKLNSGLNLAHRSQGKHDLIKNCIYKKLMQYSSAEDLRVSHHENKEHKIMLPKDAENLRSSHHKNQEFETTMPMNAQNLSTSHHDNKEYKIMLQKSSKNLRSFHHKNQEFEITMCMNAQNLSTSHHDNKEYETMLLRSSENLRGSHHKNQEFETTIPMNAESLSAYHEENKEFENILPINGYTAQVKETSKISDKRFIPSHRRSDRQKCSFTTVIRKSFDINELFKENHPKLKFLRRMNRTALKHINAKQIVSSVFRHFFHFYSLMGGNLRSGSVITKSNSNYWLQVSGVATDSGTLRLAGELFTEIAGKKVVLNIYDYLKFLIVFARTRRVLVVELVKQMMVYEKSFQHVFCRETCKRRATDQKPQNAPTQFYSENSDLRKSQSLPEMWNAERLEDYIFKSRL